MQAVLLAAGRSSRFYPFTNLEHKSLINILGKPLIIHTLNSIKASGINKIIIVINKQAVNIKNIVGNGEKLGLSIQYVYHESAQGMGQTLLDARDRIEDDFFLLNPYHVNFANFKNILEAAKKNKDEIILLSKRVNAIGEYGLVETKGDRVISITEKPSSTDTNAAPQTRIVGMYLLNKKFLDLLASLPVEHYNFEKALDQYAKQYSTRAVITQEQTISLKYAWDIFEIKNYLLENMKTYISPLATIAKSAEIIGKVYIENGVKIMEKACIKGPCYLGNNVIVGNGAVVRNEVDIEASGVVGSGMEIKNSLMLENSTTHSGFIGDSIIGANCKIAAYFCTGNVRLDRKSVKVILDHKTIDTHLHSLGVIVGDLSNLGIRVSTMPGVVLGRNVTIGPSTTVLKNVAADSVYYTKFQEIIAKKKQEKIILFDIDHTLFDTEEFKKTKLKEYSLYPEVLTVLKKIARLATLGIISEGEISLQVEKLLKTNIIQFFTNEHIHMVNSYKKIENLPKILDTYSGKKLILVENRLDVLLAAKQFRPEIFTVWIKREGIPYKKLAVDVFSPDLTISSLSDMLIILD